MKALSIIGIVLFGLSLVFIISCLSSGSKEYLYFANFVGITTILYALFYAMIVGSNFIKPNRRWYTKSTLIITCSLFVFYPIAFYSLGLCREWYNKPTLMVTNIIVGCSLVFYFGGLHALWKNSYANKRTKIIITLVVLVVTSFILVISRL